MKVRDVIKLVERDAWSLSIRLVAIANKHPFKKGRVTIAGHPSADMDKATYG